jgi:GR25 family glycosyltransferase involved in LPS biosynthesis
MMARHNVSFRFASGVRVSDEDIVQGEISEVGWQDFKTLAGFNKYLRGMVGCRRAHLRELECAMIAGLRSLLIIEDDMCLIDHWCETFRAAISELPTGWMQLYLSRGDFRPSVRISRHLRRLTGAYQTTAILYSEIGIQAAINCLRSSRSEIDHWMSNHLHPFGNSYAVCPSIAYQQGGISDIVSCDRGITA